MGAAVSGRNCSAGFQRRRSASLIRFQNAYEASARVVTVINTLLDATINLVQ
jgi:hypothetical protein